MIEKYSVIIRKIPIIIMALQKNFKQKKGSINFLKVHRFGIRGKRLQNHGMC